MRERKKKCPFETFSSQLMFPGQKCQHRLPISICFKKLPFDFFNSLRTQMPFLKIQFVHKNKVNILSLYIDIYIYTQNGIIYK